MTTRDWMHQAELTLSQIAARLVGNDLMNEDVERETLRAFEEQMPELHASHELVFDYEPPYSSRAPRVRVLIQERSAVDRLAELP